MSFALQPGMLENTSDLQTACYDICTLILDAHDLEYNIPNQRIQYLRELRIQVLFEGDKLVLNTKLKNVSKKIELIQVFIEASKISPLLNTLQYKKIYSENSKAQLKLREKQIDLLFTYTMNALVNNKEINLETKRHICVHFYNLLKINLLKSIF
jgi:hypothetical protein